MAKGGIEVAQAYVTIVPSMEGAQVEISKGLGKAAEAAGGEAGKKAGEGIAEGVGRGGEEGAKRVGQALQDGAKKTVGSVSSEVQGKLSSAFNGFGQNVMARFRSVGAGIQGTFAKVGSAISGSAFGSHLVGAASKVGSAFTAVTGTVAGVGAFIGSAFKGVSERVGSLLGPLKDRIGSAFKGAGEAVRGVLEGIASKAGEVFQAVGLSATIGLAGVAAAFAAIGKGAFDAYKSYEQLEGGARLAFGGAYDFIEQRSREAYRNVQMSQNDYLTQVNGLAVGLREAMGGNEQAAAQLADRVVTAEADIVSAMGITQESAQMAFNGIMKGNYTMLDNLQLGITPTKEGMQEVIDKVNEWRVSQGEAGDLTIDSLADCQEAVVDYVEILGYSGYAAREGSQTIEGSINSMRAAWANLLTDLGNPDGDVEARVGELVASIFGDGTEGNLGVFGNAIPIVANIASGVVSALPGAMAAIGNGVMTQLVPMVDGVTGGAATKVIEAVGPLFERVGAAVGGFMERLAPLAPVAGDIAGKLGTLLGGAVRLLVGAFEAFLPVVAQAAEVALPAINAALGFVVPIAKAVGSAMTGLVRLVAGMAGGIIAAVGSLPGFITGAWDGIRAVTSAAWDGIKTVVATVANAIGQAVTGAWNGIKAVTSAVFGAISLAASSVWNGIKATVSAVVDGIRATVSTVWNAISTVTGTVWNGIKTTVSNVVNGIKTTVSNAFDSVKATVSTVWNGIKDAIATPINTAKDAVSGAIDTIKSIVNGAHLELPKFKLPHFNIDGGSLPWGIGGKGRAPSISIDWYARGGFPGFDGSAELFVAGERGGEMVWPSYSPYIDRYADALAASMERRGGEAEAVAWLARNLGPTIAAYSPVATTRETNRRLRGAVA